jgi:hypothetical protein
MLSPEFTRNSRSPEFQCVGPARYEGNWLSWVNRPQTEAEEAALHKWIARGAPYGGRTWQRLTASRLGLESSLRAADPV